MFHALLMFCVFLPGQVTSQAVGAGSYAGYRVRQNCDPAGGTAENERIDATLNFALCCAKAGTGPKAELSPCCNNCVEQFALYCTCVFCVVCFFWCWFIQKPAIDICIRFDSHNLSLTQSPTLFPHWQLITHTRVGPNKEGR